MASAMFLNVSDSGAMQKDRPGIFYALLAAILFGLYSLLQKYVTSTGHIYSQLIGIRLEANEAIHASEARDKFLEKHEVDAVMQV